MGAIMKTGLSALKRNIVGAALGALCLIVATSVQAGDRSLPKPSFNAEGELLRPDFRFREWVYVGTPLTPNELNPPEAPFPEFHNVYIHPDGSALAPGANNRLWACRLIRAPKRLISPTPGREG